MSFPDQGRPAPIGLEAYLAPGPSSFTDFVSAHAPHLLGAPRTPASGAAAGFEAPHGTTIVALVCDGGVVIAGDKDRMIPYERAVDIIEGWPGARLVRVPGAGHMVQLEQPKLVGETIETLVRENWPV